jgi:cytochrome b
MQQDAPNVEVWDPFVRLFHWALAASVAMSWLTAESWPSLHQQTGYFILVLLGLRLLWGFIGPPNARFRQFVRPYREVLGYLASLLERRPSHYSGHNPAGGWMIVLLLATLGVTALSGWSLGLSLHNWEDLHEGAANAVLALVAVHLGGVVIASLLHRENLVRSMFSGRKNLRNDNV